jgi:hypothetical protein
MQTIIFVVGDCISTTKIFQNTTDKKSVMAKICRSTRFLRSSKLLMTRKSHAALLYHSTEENIEMINVGM